VTIRVNGIRWWATYTVGNIPSINVIEDPFSLCPSMSVDQVFLDPVHQMILESAFDELMENIRRKHFMDVCTWKVIGKWLSSISH